MALRLQSRLAGKVGSSSTIQKFDSVNSTWGGTHAYKDRIAVVHSVYSCRYSARMWAELVVWRAYRLRQVSVSTGGISGVVTDPQGAAVPGAKITITNKEQGITLGLGILGGPATSPRGRWRQART